MTKTTYRCLVIEDQLDHQTMIGWAIDLARNGFQVDVTFASTLAEALPLLPMADAVVLDLILPDTGGDTEAALRAVNEAAPWLPVLVVTSYKLTPELCHRLGALKAKSVVPKNCAIDQLWPAISTLLGNACRCHDADQELARELEKV